VVRVEGTCKRHGRVEVEYEDFEELGISDQIEEMKRA
jgi:hypothetical protein